MMTTAVWLMSVLMSATRLITYDTDISSLTALFVIACHSMMLVGYRLAGGIDRRPTIIVTPQLHSHVLATVALLYVGARFALTIGGGKVPIIGSAQTIAQNRMDLLDGNVSLFESLVQALCYPAIAFVVLTPWFWKSGRRDLVWISIVTFLAITDDAISEGGRALFVYTALGMMSTYFICYEIKIGRKFFIGLFATLLGYQLATTIYINRNLNFERNVNFYINYNCYGGYVNPMIEPVSLDVTALLLSSCYATSPLRNLDDFSQNDWDQKYGKYNLGIIFRADFDESRRDIANYYRVRGYGQNPWSTSIRDFWLDFGYWAVLAYLPLGFAFGRLTRHRYLSSEQHIIYTAMIVCAAFMIPFQSPLIIRYIIYPIVTAWLISLVTRDRPGNEARWLAPIGLDRAGKGF